MSTFSSHIYWKNLDGKVSWQFERRARDLLIEEIKNAVFLVAVSLKNPKFSNEWLESILESIIHFNGKMVITLVDSPYIDIASYGTTDMTSFAIKRQLLIQQRNEQLKRINDFAETNKSYVIHVEWQKNTNETPQWMKEEIYSAFKLNGEFKDDIITQVKKVFPEEDDEDNLATLSRFLLEEIPVLLYLYYEKFYPCIDTYPGPQANLFWKLDAGSYAPELPQVSEYIKNRGHHTYAMAEFDKN